MKNSKKIALGVFAIVMAFGIVFSLSAFKPGKFQRDSYTFYFVGDPSDQDEVRDVENWIYDDQGQSCDNVQERACTITVDEDFVDNSGTPELLPTIDLQAQKHSTLNAYYISGSDDPTMGIANKSL